MAIDLTRWAHLRPSSPGTANPERSASVTARKILAAAAQARGEKFDDSTMLAGPDQTTTHATGAGLLAVLRRMGRAAKPGEGN